MNYDALIDLGLAPAWIVAIEILKWGTKAEIRCINEPGGRRRPFTLIFEGCRAISWEVFHPEDVSEQEIAIIDLALGTRDGHELAIVAAQMFELSFNFSTFTLQKLWS